MAANALRVPIQALWVLVHLQAAHKAAGFGAASNLNLPSYTIANPHPHPPNGNAFKGVYSSSYPGEQAAAFFDVWSPPISTLYSQVFWAMLPPVPLPLDVVRRFQNDTMVSLGGW